MEERSKNPKDPKRFQEDMKAFGARFSGSTFAGLFFRFVEWLSEQNW